MLTASLSPPLTQPSLEPLSLRIGRAIRLLRQKRRLSQDRLAQSMKTSRPYLSRLERGVVSPSISTLERAALALGVDLCDLFQVF
jgi:transcriptional regulator with XRE-family HTH domain